MDIAIRTATSAELAALSALCLRAKAVWGYDDAFLDACREELTLTAGDLARSALAVAESAGRPVGVVQIEIAGDEADLLKLFVDPDAMGRGIGSALMRWAVATSRGAGAVRMTIEADPDAMPFYRRMGAVEVGTAPSGSVPGRVLPLLHLDLDD